MPQLFAVPIREGLGASSEGGASRRGLRRQRPQNPLNAVPSRQETLQVTSGRGPVFPSRQEANCEDRGRMMAFTRPKQLPGRQDRIGIGSKLIDRSNPRNREIIVGIRVGAPIPIVIG